MLEALRSCLQQQGVRTVFKSDTTLRSHLVRPTLKDTVNPNKQGGVVCKIHVNVAKSLLERREDLCMNGLRDTIETRLARTQTSAVSEHADTSAHYPLWGEAKLIYRPRPTSVHP